MQEEATGQSPTREGRKVFNGSREEEESDAMWRTHITYMASVYHLRGVVFDGREEEVEGLR